MPLTETEKGQLDGLLEAERQRQRTTAPANLFWLVEVIAANTIRSEALRLTTEARVAKQAEVDAWPAKAQDHLAELQTELAALTTLEGKLTP